MKCENNKAVPKVTQQDKRDAYKLNSMDRLKMIHLAYLSHLIEFINRLVSSVSNDKARTNAVRE